MHMADALLSPAVGISMCAAGAGAIAYSLAKIKKDELSDKRLPLMAVSGAFVFAAQMINFTIPGTGSSGHIGGGILLAALLGANPALLTIAAVLVIQCLFFADGGLLALGCNVFNMGVIPCLVVYPLLFKPLAKKMIQCGKKGYIWLASILSVVVALQLGAFAVVLQTTASKITALPFGTFVSLMQPIHLAIGVVEGIVTAAVLAAIYAARPEIIESATNGEKLSTVGAKKVVAIIAVCAVVVAVLISVFASSNPDGLEWSIEKIVGSTELESAGIVHEKAQSIQDATSILPDYDFPESGKKFGTSTAGLVGTALTFALSLGTALVITLVKKSKKEKREN